VKSSPSGNKWCRRRSRRFCATAVLSPLGPGDDHVHLPATTIGTDKPLTPIENRRVRTVWSSHLGRVRLNLVAARLAPNDEPNVCRSRVAERHRRAGW